MTSYEINSFGTKDGWQGSQDGLSADEVESKIEYHEKRNESLTIMRESDGTRITIELFKEGPVPVQLHGDGWYGRASGVIGRPEVLPIVGQSKGILLRAGKQEHVIPGGGINPVHVAPIDTVDSKV